MSNHENELALKSCDVFVHLTLESPAAGLGFKMQEIRAELLHVVENDEVLRRQSELALENGDVFLLNLITFLLFLATI